MRNETHSKKVFPVGLIAEGRDCLVVGGGKVATRKVGLLLDAKSDVTVVSPKASPEIRELAEHKRSNTSSATSQKPTSKTASLFSRRPTKSRKQTSHQTGPAEKHPLQFG